MERFYKTIKLAAKFDAHHDLQECILAGKDNLFDYKPLLKIMCINLRGKFDGFLPLLLLLNPRMHSEAR